MKSVLFCFEMFVQVSVVYSFIDLQKIRMVLVVSIQGGGEVNVSGVGYSERVIN